MARLNKKQFLQFPLKRKGYGRNEVDCFIKTQRDDYDKRFFEQQQCFDEMKAENERLHKEIIVFTERENEIKKVLVAATEKASDMSADLKLQYALEIERLKIFQAKWANSYEEIRERYHFDKDALNMESVVANTSLEIERLLYKDFGIKLTPNGNEPEKQFKSELERLGINQDEIIGLVAALKKEIKEVS